MSRPRTTHTRTHIRTADPPAADAFVSAAPQLLRLLHLASPALPIGAFHLSHGLEDAVECGWVKDEASALEWIEGLASASLTTLDLPVLERLRSAWRQDDAPDVLRWNAFLIASRETEELRAEDRHLGSRTHHRAFSAQRGKHSTWRVACHCIRVRLRMLGHRAHGVLADLCVGVGGESGAGGRETGAARAECRAEDAACALRAHPSFGRARTQSHRFRHRHFHRVECGG